MKKILIFVGGVITGAALVFGIAAIAALADVVDSTGITLFESEGECISRNSFEVFQVVEKGHALAKEDKFLSDLVVLFLNEGEPYYDSQVIKIPAGKCVKQVGTYRYESKSEMIKTVPVVRVLDE